MAYGLFIMPNVRFRSIGSLVVRIVSGYFTSSAVTMSSTHIVAAMM